MLLLNMANNIFLLVGSQFHRIRRETTRCEFRSPSLFPAAFCFTHSLTRSLASIEKGIMLLYKALRLISNACNFNSLHTNWINRLFVPGVCKLCTHTVLGYGLRKTNCIQFECTSATSDLVFISNVPNAHTVYTFHLILNTVWCSHWLFSPCVCVCICNWTMFKKKKRKKGKTENTMHKHHFVFVKIKFSTRAYQLIGTSPSIELNWQQIASTHTCNRS